jgi:hypothetical protein
MGRWHDQQRVLKLLNDGLHHPVQHGM